MFALSARRVGALAAALMISATPALASESAEGGPPNLLDPNVGVMAWTLIIFVLLLFVLSKFAFKPLLAAVEAEALKRGAIKITLEVLSNNHPAKALYAANGYGDYQLDPAAGQALFWQKRLT